MRSRLLKHVASALEGLLDRVDTPMPIVVIDTVQSNISRMQEFANTRGLRLRPHVKTHKCIEIGRLQTDAGACGITAGTIREAEVFAGEGFRDIFLAYPIWAAGSKAARIRHLAESIELRVGVDSRAAIDRLAESMRGASSRLQVVVEVDCGAHRSGVVAEVAGELARYAAKVGLEPVGVYTYPGQGGSGPAARRPAADEQLSALETAVASLQAVGIEPAVVSAGSTPTAEYSDRAPITEIRPGEYVFCDLDNLQIGACTEEQVALLVAATVVSDTMSDHVIVDVGTKALGREGSPQKGYGRALGVGDGRLLKLNEYHGFLCADSRDRPAVGTVLPIIPNHVCPVVNSFDELVVTDAAGASLERWAVAARGV
jgi:D-serine deaminase-like pyridoxal phosphate-dependent protein